MRKFSKPYVIAEVASTHEGDHAYLTRLIDAVAHTGADAIKFQVFKADEVVSKDHPDLADFTAYEFTESEWQKAICHAQERGLAVWVDLLCPYSTIIVDANLNAITGVKLPPSDTHNRLLLDYINTTSLDLIIGCGGTTIVEIIETLNYLAKEEREIVLMHGFQAYPTAFEDTALNRMRYLKEIFPYTIGFADHYDGADPFALYLPLIALTAGARVIEKHSTCDRTEKRDDYYSALDPAAFKTMTTLIHAFDSLWGNERIILSPREVDYRQKVKRVTVSTKNIPAGDRLTPDAVHYMRGAEKREPVSLTKTFTVPLKSALSRKEVLADTHLAHNIGIFINARLHSTGLPRKALKPLYGGYTTIEYLLKRLQSYPTLPGTIVFATSTDPEDEPLMDCAQKIGVEAFRGAPLDVMLRMLEVANAYSFDTLVRVTGDDVFVSGEYIEKTLQYHFHHNLEYTLIDGLAYGAECEVIDVTMLKHIHPYVCNKQGTEYLTWFLDANGVCKNGVMEADEADKRPTYRLTLDYEEDYELMKDLAAICHKQCKEFYIPLSLINTYLDTSAKRLVNTEKFMKLKNRNELDVSLKYAPTAGVMYEHCS